MRNRPDINGANQAPPAGNTARTARGADALRRMQPGVTSPLARLASTQPRAVIRMASGQIGRPFQYATILRRETPTRLKSWVKTFHRVTSSERNSSADFSCRCCRPIFDAYAIAGFFLAIEPMPIELQSGLQVDFSPTLRAVVVDVASDRFGLGMVQRSTNRDLFKSPIEKAYRGLR